MNHQTTLTREDLGTVKAMVLHALESLNKGAAGQAASGEDGIAPFLHGAFVFEFVNKPKALQSADSAQEVAQAGDVKAPVQGAGVVAHADNHGVAATVAAGLGFNGRHYVFVVGAWGCPINELSLHSSLSGCDIAMLTYAAKYMHKAAGVDVATGDSI